MADIFRNMGYNPRFGVTFVDRQDGFKRYPKKSTETVKKIFDHATGAVSGQIQLPLETSQWVDKEKGW